MKHAYLIIAHNQPFVLETLLRMLDDARNSIFLHIDARSKELKKKMKSVEFRAAELHIIEPSINVYWGDITQLKVEYLLFETAAAHGPYAYYHLLSGADLPIQTQDTIHAFFEANAGKEFVNFWHDYSHQRDLERKVFRYYLFTKRLKDKKNAIHGITAFIRNSTLAIQKATHFKRKKTFEFKKGSQWVSLTHDFVECLIHYKDLVMKRMRYTLAPDEIFIQTIIWNTPFRSRIYDLSTPQKGNMRLIDWERGFPYSWKEKDLSELLESDKMFARKFHADQSSLIKQLEKMYAPAH